MERFCVCEEIEERGSVGTSKVCMRLLIDRHVVEQNRIRFVQKLRSLLLSKSKLYMSLHILSKCLSFLSLSKPRLHNQALSYSFRVFNISYPPMPLNATETDLQLCICLIPAAESLSTQEAYLKSSVSVMLANRLQKFLMLSPHLRLVLSKLIHLGPDFVLPINFWSRLCSEHPDKFKTVDTSYGCALELVSWDPDLATSLKKFRNHTKDLRVD